VPDRSVGTVIRTKACREQPRRLDRSR
jgi:hypothetical protein